VLRFGTDGVRGDADADLPTPFVVALGRAAARVLGPGEFVVGRDTRASGPRIERDLAHGLTLEGATVLSVGVMPTPGIAYVAQRDGAPAAVISASHNPWHDNGIKLLAAGGRKLADAVEEEVEVALEACYDPVVPDPEGPAVPDGAEEQRAADDYVAHLAGALGGRSLGGLRVVLDCANGAASEVGPRALAAAGAEVVVVHAAPDGRNINDRCGSTHPAALQEAVARAGADLGLALDGDADRVLAVDETGALVDGDQIMTALALDLDARGALPERTIAVTVMSNLGLHRALAAHGLGAVVTPVGDRNVLVALEEHGLALGGEQSGHVILPAHATTGDGLLTGLLLCDLVVRLRRPLSHVAAVMTRLPQVLENVRVARRPDLDAADGLWQEVRAVEAELGDRGRVLVRASGTEPVVRVMVEAETHDEAEAAVQRLVAAVVRAFDRETQRASEAASAPDVPPAPHVPPAPGEGASQRP
jgi:phosphoglucosamine mutase